MLLRRSLSVPILLAIVMIVLLGVLTVGWVLLAVTGALKSEDWAGLYWTLLSVGTTFIVLLIAGVVLYLILSVKAISLTQRQSNFIDAVTHELKSPIASMKLCLQTLSRHQVGRAEQTDFYRYMLEDLERLDHLINQVLDAGMVEARRTNGPLEAVPLGPLLAECAEGVCASYRLPPETVELRLAPCAVRARRGDLDMVFRNLLDNAVKYAGAEPRVELSAGPAQDGTVVARVGDNGRGIPPKVRRKIFGRFFRAGAELERDRRGTGLGLYIVGTLVRQMRGRISVSDRPDGPGTVFEVRLPGAPMPETDPAAPVARTDDG
jgi:two-component system, OmpR family, phosphate regulon sensor histidine kinase PhoR